VISVTDPCGRILRILDWNSYFFFKVAPQLSHEAEWAPFQTHYFLENLVAPGIEPRPLDLYQGTLTTRPQRRSMIRYIRETYEINAVISVMLRTLAPRARLDDLEK
jgi:hypothetical protein